MRESVQQLFDRRREQLLKLHARPPCAVLPRRRSLIHRIPLDTLQRTKHRAYALLAEVVHVRVPTLCVVDDFFGRRAEHAFEKVSRPLQRVLDLVRKVLQRADRNTLFRRVSRRAVALRQVRNHYLHVSFCSERAAFQKRLLVIHAPLIHVQPGLHVIQRVAHARQRLPKSVVEHLLRIRAHTVKVRRDFHIAVHRAYCERGC
mmetsp:Transcript_6328/g.13495  ORF Transcript_6328/g.13495 Transcript_6328/m.13495 type:complete len:203 (+) Transcript_6328:2792-3400(+)